MVFPEQVISLLFGPEYISAASSLRILAVGSIFLSFSDISNRIIIMTGRSRLIFYDLIFASILNVIINILLIPKYGIIGAATGTMISFVTLTLIFNIQSYRIASIIPIRKGISNVLAALLVSVLILLIAKLVLPSGLISFLVLSLLFCLSYLLLIFLFKGFDKTDLEIIKSFGKRLLRKS